MLPLKPWSTNLLGRPCEAISATEDTIAKRPQSWSRVANLLNVSVRRQRRVVSCTFSAELNRLVDSIEQLLLFQTTLRQVFCGTSQTDDEIVESELEFEFGSSTRTSCVFADAKCHIT